MDEWSTFKEPVRIGMMASLLYATYLVAMCPCEKPVGCKQGQFYLALALPAAATFVINLSTSIKNE
jgi:hypothetical protein